MAPDAPPPFIGALGLGGTDHRLPLSVPADPRPGVTSGVRGNLGQRDTERQPAPPFRCASRSLRARFSCSMLACPKMHKPKLPIAGEFWEVRDDPREDLERPVEMAALVGRHQAGAKQGTSGGDGGMKRDVRVDAGVEERLPEEYGLPVLSDQHRDDGGHGLGSVWKRPRLDHPQPQVTEALTEIAAVVEELSHQLRAVRANDLQRAERGTHRRRDGGGAEHEGPRGDLEELDHVRLADDEATARGEALRERAHAQIDLVLEAEELARACAAGPKDTDAVRLVDHQASAVAVAEPDDVGKVADVALHREHAIHHDEDPTAIPDGALEHLLELVHLVVPER